VIYEFRKYHSAVVYGKHMLVYGGLNPKNLILDSCIVLNLQILRDTVGIKPTPLAGQATCAVYFLAFSKSLMLNSRKFEKSDIKESIFSEDIMRNIKHKTIFIY
jgi:hypothetical protein